ncbi:MAG: type II toxin-antitoxin system VapC family toxin [Pseudomonadota bacterium]|nr:type II toxin-antitoxin system VapC family toxin [Pseudomonadota bacterium]
MIRYLLDTNICIYMAVGCPPSVAARVDACFSSEVAISSITLAELEHGVLKKGTHDQLQRIRARLQVLPFDEAAARCFADIAVLSTRQRSAMDKLIAAHALSLGATLVTNNEADYMGYPIAIENWAVPA